MSITLTPVKKKQRNEYQVHAYRKETYKRGKHSPNKITNYFKYIYSTINKLEELNIYPPNNIALDLFAFHSDYPSTCNTLLTTGCKVYAYGNEVDCEYNKMQSKENLTIYQVDDVTQLKHKGKSITENRFGRSPVYLTSIDPCGYINDKWLDHMMQNSMITVLTLQYGIYRAIRIKEKQGKKSIFGKKIPDIESGGRLKEWYIYDALFGRARKRGIIPTHITTTNKQDIIGLLNLRV